MVDFFVVVKVLYVWLQPMYVRNVMLCVCMLHSRKNHQRQLEALQQSLDEETKAKNDNARMRKQAEAQCNELQGSIEAKDKVREVELWSACLLRTYGRCFANSVACSL